MEFSGSYIALIQRFPLKPITSDEELIHAIAVIDSLIDRDQLDSDEQKYLNELSTLVMNYEESIPFE